MVSNDDDVDYYYYYHHHHDYYECNILIFYYLSNGLIGVKIDNATPYLVEVIDKRSDLEAKIMCNQ